MTPNEQQYQPVPQPGMPPEQIGSPEHIVEPLTPERAVQAAMSVAGLPESAVLPRPDPEALRPIGRHMLGLIRSPEASPEQRLGARIVLTNGTKVERQLLFLQDSADVVHEAGQRGNWMWGGSTDIGGTAAATLPQLGSVEALMAVENSRSVRNLASKVSEGHANVEDSFRAAAASTFEKVLPKLMPDDAAALLKLEREMRGAFSFIDTSKPEVLRQLAEKASQFEVNQVEDRTLVAEVLHEAAGRASQHAWQEDGGWFARRRARKLAEVANEANVAAYRTLPEDVRNFCTQTTGELNVWRLGSVVNIYGQGLSHRALGGVLRADPTFVDAVGGNGRFDVASIGSVGEMIADHGVTEQLADALRSGWTLREHIHDLRVLGEIQHHPIVQRLGGNSVDLQQLVQIVKYIEPGQRGHALNLLAEQEIDDQALRAMVHIARDGHTLGQLVTVLNNPNGEQYGQLRQLLTIPGFSEYLGEDKFQGISGADLLLSNSYSRVRNELAAITEVPDFKKLLADDLIGPQILEKFLGDIVRETQNQWEESSSNTLQRQAEKLVEFFAFPGVRDSYQALAENNPMLAEQFMLPIMHRGFDTIAQAGLLRRAAALPPEALSQAELDNIQATRVGNLTEASVLYYELNLEEVLDNEGPLAAHRVELLSWVLDYREDGNQADRTALLRSKEWAELSKLLQESPHGEELASYYSMGLKSRILADATQFNKDVLTIMSEHPISQSLSDTGLNQEGVQIAWEVMIGRCGSPLDTADRLAALIGHDAGTLQTLHDQGDDALRSVLIGLAYAEDPERYAEEWRGVIQNTRIFTLLGESSPAYPFREQALAPIFASRRPLALARRLESQLTSDRPLWLSNYEFSQMVVESKPYANGLMISEIPMDQPPLDHRPSRDELRKMLNGELSRPFEEMSVDEKRALVGDQYTDDQLASMQTVPFAALSTELQQGILLHRMFEAVERSRSLEFRTEATNRNVAAILDGRGPWQSGELLHFTHDYNTGTLLLSGNLAGEISGRDNNGNDDFFPYNVDFIEVDRSLLDIPTVQQRFSALPGSFGDVCLHYQRGPGSFSEGEEYEAPNPNLQGRHRLMLGGMPATEISAITISRPEQLISIREQLIETGMYAPIYDRSGELLFTPGEYFDRRSDGNYEAVEPEIVDNAVMIMETQAGSTEGGIVYMPTPEGQMDRHYVKFAPKGNADHIWTQILTDKFLATVNPAFATETRAVRIEGRLARASRMIENQGVTNSGRNASFVVTCFTADWDAVYSPNNLVQQGPVAAHADTGGALDYMGSGQKKGSNGWSAFGPEVHELNDGSESTGDLGNGIRQYYPDLTNAQIKQQAAELQAALPDDTIDQLVDSVRRSRPDREMIKRVAKARRDYIVAYAAGLA